jgi:hypothetical protein
MIKMKLHVEQHLYMMCAECNWPIALAISAQ